MAQHYLAHFGSRTIEEAQVRNYGAILDRMRDAPGADLLGPEEREFIARRDSFYMASLSETGWPYIQHRGGPPGFLRVLAPDRLAFADLRGNRQMLSTGNIAANERVSLFLVDYPRRERLKILGRARVALARDETGFARLLAPPELAGKVERVVTIEVVSFDWNCPKYITPRYSAAEVEELVSPMRARIAELEQQLRAASDVSS
jgi:uncharacterized protein